MRVSKARSADARLALALCSLAVELLLEELKKELGRDEQGLLLNSVHPCRHMPLLNHGQCGRRALSLMAIETSLLEPAQSFYPIWQKSTSVLANTFRESLVFAASCQEHCSSVERHDGYRF